LFFRQRQLAYHAKPERPDPIIPGLLETSPVDQQEDMEKTSVIGAVMGDARVGDAIVANPQHYIVAGLGSRPTDSICNPWNAACMLIAGLVPAVSFDRLQTHRSHPEEAAG
jgi:Mn-containing catalase